jgi:multidrug efflux pump subunit AcrA (membrane-fusion protein)
MDFRACCGALLGGLIVGPGLAHGQAATTAKVEAVAIELKAPDRYQIYSVLEPIRRVTLTAPSDGILRSLELPVGAAVRERQEVAQFDRAEAAALAKIAQAQVREARAALKGAANAEAAQAQLEAAEARGELAALALDRCTLRAPFAGRLLDVAVSPGQYLPKGAKVAELADVSSLRVLVPLDRGKTSVGATVKLQVEGQAITGKVQALLPLSEALAPLHELTTALSAAWVVLPNPKSELEPGQRVLGPSLPTAPIATIPARALHEPAKGQSGGPTVQLIRNEYVTNLPVRVLGHPGPERVQVSGLLRPADRLIVSSSVPLVAGTLIRFSPAAAVGEIEGTNPNPAEGGELAGITPPRSAARSSATTRAASTTAGGARSAPRPAPPARTPAPAPANTKGTTAPPPF